MQLSAAYQELYGNDLVELEALTALISTEDTKQWFDYTLSKLRRNLHKALKQEAFQYNVVLNKGATPSRYALSNLEASHIEMIPQRQAC